MVSVSTEQLRTYTSLNLLRSAWRYHARISLQWLKKTGKPKSEDGLYAGIGQKREPSEYKLDVLLLNERAWTAKLHLHSTKLFDWFWNYGSQRAALRTKLANLNIQMEINEWREIQRRKLPGNREAGPWVTLSLTGLSPRRPGFVPGSLHVEFVAHKVAMEQVSLWGFFISPVNIISPPFSTLTHHMRDERETQYRPQFWGIL